MQWLVLFTLNRFKINFPSKPLALPTTINPTINETKNANLMSYPTYDYDPNTGMSIMIPATFKISDFITSAIAPLL